MRLFRIGIVVLAGAVLAGCAQVNGAAADPPATAVPSVTAVPSATTSPTAGPMPPATPPLGPVVVVTAGCVNATATPTSLPGSGQHSNMAPLAAVFERVDPQLRQRFASVYALVRLDLDRDRIQVFRKPSAAFDRWVATTFAADCLEVFDAPYSEAQLWGFAHTIQQDMAYWAEQGIALGSFQPDGVRGVVVIGVLGDVERAKKALPERYGPGVPIDVEQGKIPQF